MKLTIGFSPCPNDTFIFDALVNQKIDTGELFFEPVVDDVEQLNVLAMEGKLDITKLSFPALFETSAIYQLLDSGAALGKGVGPLLVSLPGKKWTTESIAKATIAIPGVHTTANLLLSFTYPGANQKKAFVFSEIEDAVLSGQTGLGVIIHENRFTYQQKGLEKVTDLGEQWETRMQVPVPLGGIAIRKDLGTTLKAKVEELIRQSLAYAFSNYPEISEYVTHHAQTMEESVMRKHIELYVNEFTKTLGEAGWAAVEKLREVYLSR